MKPYTLRLEQPKTRRIQTVNQEVLNSLKVSKISKSAWVVESTALRTKVIPKSQIERFLKEATRSL